MCYETFIVVSQQRSPLPQASSGWGSALASVHCHSNLKTGRRFHFTTLFGEILNMRMDENRDSLTPSHLAPRNHLEVSVVKRKPNDVESRKEKEGAPAPFAKRLAVTPASFYASSQRRAQCEERILSFLASIQRRLRGDTLEGDSCWQEYPTQRAAFDFIDKEDPHNARSLHVFSRELTSDGKRRFIVASPNEFWRRYKAMPPGSRHYYEIIRQGRPCHLYFDLEYELEENSEKDGAAMVTYIIEEVSKLFLERCAVSMDPDRDVLELDSSTPSKFSRHLIIQIPDMAFATNIHVGAFVNDLCERSSNSCPLVQKAGRLIHFIDMGVYTKNRSFRLYLSSKVGKGIPLKVTDRFRGGSKIASSQRDIFFFSLVSSGIDERGRVLHYPARDSQPPSSMHKIRSTSRKNGENVQVSYGPSPFPCLDSFIQVVCSASGGPPGHIASWTYMPDCALILYSIAGNRWCGNISRQHKSNRVFYVVDLKENWWCQRCYDPECRGYRSVLTPLPMHLSALLELLVAGDEQEGGDDKDELENQELIEALENYEGRTS